MIQGYQVNCVPVAHTFQRQYDHEVTRTQVKPKAFHVNYFADGTGRDTFVKNDNGGFYKFYEPVKAPAVTSFTAKRQWVPPSPIIKSRGVYYRSDGSGRDAYIEFNSGGLNNQFKHNEYRERFKASLRQIDRPQSAYVKCGGRQVGIRATKSVTTLPKFQKEPCQKEVFIRSQMTFNQKFVRGQSALSRYQKDLDSRLSQPKFQRPKVVEQEYLRKSTHQRPGSTLY